ncbi:hypothetical protein [Sinorhizobium meliloti]|uniref:hypothetical protein n=1 Tax=Rhizobium meliloti TaxID=382 RepID=UPI000FDA77C6|nr:hypothetical protein [Sinorhizobium meliloti]RVJ48620.1 hypothetical protein CN175_23645 [Sinorhizobium meliloti]
METITKLLSNPAVNIVVSIVIGFLLARYAYKINYLNKTRYRKYFRRKIRRIHFTLFQRRDAFFAHFILKAAFSVILAVFGMTFWSLSVVVTLNKDAIPSELVANSIPIVLGTLNAATAMLFFFFSTHMTSEAAILRSPRGAIRKLKDELLNSDKRELLDDSEVAEFTNALAKLEDELHHLSKMAVRPPSWITPVAPETPAASKTSLPVQ